MRHIKLKSLLNEGSFFDFFKTKSAKQNEKIQKLFGWAYLECNYWRDIKPSVAREFVKRLSELMDKKDIPQFIQKTMDKTASDGNWNRVEFLEAVEHEFNKMK